MTEPTFPFEKLVAYQQALRFAHLSETVVANSKGKISLALTDQLSRAALSIPLNIAEANGRWHKGEKRQYFWVARGSVFECVPIIQILKQRQIISTGEYRECYLCLQEIAKTLSGLIKSVETNFRLPAKME